MKMSISPPIEQIDKKINTNLTEIQKNFSNEITVFETMFNIEYFIAIKHGAFLGRFVDEEEHTGLMWTAFGKNMISFYSAFDLTKRGLVGSARMLLRHILEFLIIAKFISISKNSILINKWHKGEDIWMNKDVFSKIKTKSPEIEDFWKLLCQYAHGTIYSQQIELGWKENEREIRLNFIFLSMLMEMNYHLLNSHIINRSLEYYVSQFDEREEMVFYKNKIKEVFSHSKRSMLPEPKKVIRDYKMKWILK
ncbi:hypothetical protein [Brevibacillus sp. Leaf182]|uniref:hypothetical protein n=1 Tax=Brevibacillus sp. Leaf182 TaxID=1736290 RepID=UPI0006F87AA2|nr:hypothetical protein [Brevibacillus sp. Leaf182]RAT97856.1 hypothetical protein ASG16_009420 [Brevibacillus sp. Leaf182]